MNRITAALLVTVVVSACSREVPPTAQNRIDPFVGVDTTSIPAREQRIIANASEDFRAVVQGGKPIHAKPDKSEPLSSDGGTTFYKGDGYRLTVLMSLSTFGKLEATAYGPILTFDSAFAPEYTPPISDIRVYSNEALRALLQD